MSDYPSRSITNQHTKLVLVCLLLTRNDQLLTFPIREDIIIILINCSHRHYSCAFSQKKQQKLSETTPRSLVLQKPQRNNKAVKLILCGNAAVGKTSITTHYKGGIFKKFHDPNLAGTYQGKRVTTKTGQEIQLNIWDTAGDERWRSIMPIYYRDAQIVLLVFDLTDYDSFKGMDYWFGDLQQKVKTEGMLLCLIGNKKDLNQQRQVSKEQGQLKASQRRNCLYHEVSALSGEGIEELFEKVIEEYVKRKDI